MVNGEGIDAVSQWVGNYKQRIEVNIRGRTLAEHNAIRNFSNTLLYDRRQQQQQQQQ